MNTAQLMTLLRGCNWKDPLLNIDKYYTIILLSASSQPCLIIKSIQMFTFEAWRGSVSAPVMLFSLWFAVTDGPLDWTMTACWWKFFNMYQSWQRSTGEVCVNKPSSPQRVLHSKSDCRWTACEGRCVGGGGGGLISIFTSQICYKWWHPWTLPSPFNHT